jgi:hypothetical protein
MQMNFLQFLEQDSMYIAYTAVVLYDLDQKKLIKQFEAEIPQGWQIKGDHMTINLGSAEEGPAASLLNQSVELTVKAIARNNKVLAVAVDSKVPSLNKQKHITLAIAPEGKAQDSNELVRWQPISTLVVRGVIREVKKEGQPKIRIALPPKPKAPNDPHEFVQSLGNKPINVIQMALRGKFPNLSAQEIEKLIN